ncbi:phage holin family protein [Tsuneonella sp. YG55]|uniref:Phage holin family protein n=1 Tax=Tsuneonella litorea TaxID=2976475 RepID=A0A9X3AM86_9SPHN|nr:phage holin family protein [Tsuneonella litorea]MCT2558032.1 phage holin family protein [Tsuneonella litorea]
MNTHDPDLHFADEDRPVGEADPEKGSLTDDIVALFDDGRTMVEAEIQFQKTRAAFAFDRGRSGAFYGIAAFALVHLALVALVVGLVIALTPLIGPWGATGAVVFVLLAAGTAFALAARRKFARLAQAYSETRE